jgi:nitrogen fixation protein FixH
LIAGQGSVVSSKGSWWAFAPALLLGSMLIGLGSMAVIAVDDPSFAIESDYYRKATSWDATRAQAAANGALGWSVDVRAGEPAADGAIQVTVAITSERAPLMGASVRAQAFPNARASELHELEFEEVASGVYQARLRRPRLGIWEFRVQVRHGQDTYADALRLELVKGRSP